MAPLIEGRVLALLLLAPLTPMQRIAWNLSPCAVSVSLVYVHLVRRNVTIGVVVLALSGLWATGTGLAVSPAAKRPCAKPMVGKTAKGGTLKCKRVGKSYRWVAIPRKANPATTPTPATSYPNETVSQKSARRKAEDYLRITPFSRTGLITQLKYEGFSTDDATYAVTILSPDWNQQAAAKAQDYLRVMPFSRTGLITQLEYEGFTQDEAVYGVNSTGL